MIFAEKLSFLMQLTSTSNKQLAAAVKVDPSLISRFRSARRNPPKNLTYTKAMADYLARRCEGDYQRIALSEALGRKHLQMQMETGQLSAILFDWLTDDRDQVGHFLNTFERFSFETPERAGGGPPSPSVPGSDPSSFAYYGSEGKRGAIDAFLAHLLAADEPGTVLFFNDESLEWLYEDRRYLSRLLQQMTLLLQRGFRLWHIAAPLQTADQAFDSLSAWLPLYMTGRVESYYYPRLRDDLLRRTLIILPDGAAVISTSTSGQSASHATIFTQDHRLANAYAREFHDLLSKCLPMMTAYSAGKKADGLLRCIAQFESDRGSRIQQSTTLSAITAPPELIRLAVKGLSKQEASVISTALFNAQELFRQSLAQYEVVDIHSLDTAEDVRAGRAPISAAYLRQDSLPCYTAETYALHLQNILNLMERYPNYRAVLLPRRGDVHALMVKSGRQAILLRPVIPLTVFEFSPLNIVEACREYLLRRIESPLSPAMQRQETMSKLRRMVQELKK